MQATLWANVSWMDHTVKVRSTTCQVEGKRLILKMNLLPSFGDINKKNIHSLVRLYVRILLSQCSRSFSPGLSLF